MDIAKKYQKLPPIKHILEKPGMYIGGVDEIESNVWILDKDKIIEKNIEYSPGLYKIFDEILVNAYDQTIRDSTLKNIKVSINKELGEITVENDGKGIDVVIHPKEKIWVPELIFSHLLTSTSFSKESSDITGGTHGLGAKLTVIFSKYFKLEIGDSINKKEFTQFYKNNLSFRSKPIVKNYNGKGYVRVTFQPDLDYFKLKELNEDIVNLMRRRVYDLSFLAINKKIFLNNNEIQINSFEKYVDLFGSDDIKIKEYYGERWKVIITKSNGGFKQISFVNGIYTNNGGTHVNYVVGKAVNSLKGYIQSKYKTNKIKDKFIKDQFWFFISSVIRRPTFSSQTKDELLTSPSNFGSEFNLSDNFVKNIFKKFSLDEVIKKRIRYIQSADLSKMDSKKKNVIKNVEKLHDANFAGTKKSELCTLILTEGDSAKTMAISGLSVIPKGNNIYGIFPLKGKLLNVREASHKQIINNSEFKNLKKIIGLEMNKVYTKDNISSLRYGKILLMMDADVDGSHIKGLFINMIHYYFPSLLKIKGFIQFFITPVVKISKKDISKSFYTLDDYNEWRKNINDISKWSIKYYKGLGTNTAKEAREYFSNLDKHVIDLEWVDSSNDSITLAFAKDQSDKRKDWLKEYDEHNILDYDSDSITYKDFIHKELIHFSNNDIIRSIPNLLDGFKPAQRKVLYACLKRNLTNDIKVSQLVGYISENTAYHHGENSLIKTVIGMAQNFLGSNNINLLKPQGQFGTRLMGGKDHSSARYIFTSLADITRLIFHKDDDPLLDYLDDDGFMIEPKYYVPIIPMILVNGADGIGTGYSTYIPKFNPMDLINNIRRRINGESFIKMEPWYRNFKGKIVKIETNIYVTKGIYDIEDRVINIKELPVTSWTENYKVFLETGILEHKSIKRVINNSNETEVDFSVKFAQKEDIKKILNLEKFFQLVKIINMNNMHLYNENNTIEKYDAVKKIFDNFYRIRLMYYQKRKIYLLKKLKDDIKILSSKIKFIDLIISKKINIYNKPKDQIIKILSEKSLLKLPDEPPYDYLIRMSFYSFTKEKIDELKKQLDNKNGIYNSINKKRPEDIWLDDLKQLENYLAKFIN